MNLPQTPTLSAAPSNTATANLASQRKAPAIQSMPPTLGTDFFEPVRFFDQLGLGDAKSVGGKIEA